MSRKIPIVINQEEFERLIKEISKYLKKSRDIKSYRLALLLGFESGLRISEIIGLTKEYSRCCKVPIQKRKEQDTITLKKRFIYFCPTCQKELSIKDKYRPNNKDWEVPPLTKDKVEDTHLNITQAKGNKDRVTSRPKRMNEIALNLLPLKIPRRSLQNFTEKLGLKVLNKKISFHTLRHSFATHFFNKTDGDMRTLQMLLGHSRMDTTSIYAHVNPEKAIQKARDIF